MIANITPPHVESENLIEYGFRLAGWNIISLNNTFKYFGINRAGGWQSTQTLSPQTSVELGDWLNCVITTSDNNIVLMLSWDGENSNDKYWCGLNEDGSLIKIINSYDATYSKTFSVFVKQS